MGRGVARPQVRPVRGPLRYETHEVRHLMGLHAQTLQMSAENLQLGRGALGRAGVLLPRMAGELRRFADLSGSASVEQNRICTNHPDPTVANARLAQLEDELHKYRYAVEQIGDPLERRLHASNLRSVIEEQEERARSLFAADQAPPFHVIVSAQTMRAAGLRADEFRTICDRKLAWRVWESTAWDPDALRSNQAACNRDQNRITTGVDVPVPWLVKAPHELQHLARRVAR